MNKYDTLKLENQLCFPLYACSKEVVRHYKPFLDPLDLTYTQYIVMMVLWERQELNVKELGQRLYLDSGTLTPLLKKLEAKELLRRHRSENDERNLLISVTDKGMSLREEALGVPALAGRCMQLSEEEAASLCSILNKILQSLEHS